MKDKMKAAVFESEGNLVLKEVPVPSIDRHDDVLVRIESASICGTDLHILEVPPRISSTKRNHSWT